MDFNSLPPELAHEITSYLSHDEIRNFSLCSKFWRELSLPILFRAIYISCDTPRAFSPGGALSHISPAVRHVSLDTARHIAHKNQTEEISETVEYYRICAAGLQVFPRLESIMIYYESLTLKYAVTSTLSQFDGRLFHGVFEEVSRASKPSPLSLGSNSYPFANTPPPTPLKEVQFSFIDHSHRHWHNGNNQKEIEWSYDCLSLENKRFLGLLSDSGDTDRCCAHRKDDAVGELARSESSKPIAEVESPDYPATLEEARIDILGVNHFSMLDGFNPYGVIQNSAETLKKLVLFGTFNRFSAAETPSTMDKPIIFPFPNTVFPNVKEIYIGPCFTLPVYFGELVWRFPEVELMKVMVDVGDLERMGLDEMDGLYTNIGKMKKLKMMLVPCLMFLESQRLLAYLKQRVEDWINGGSTELERVMFVKESDTQADYDDNLVEVWTFTVVEASDSDANTPWGLAFDLRTGVTDEELETMG
ncbi:hypothetical protein TWF694_003383 [Orbilia ellipsospora]|uniref:F-box domain-containing protein n=1 Tax=Orbilia ellipsospora TaxID=2528407 RepID=A0AAV9WY10_9PEZI